MGATTFSTGYQIKLIGDGQESNTWGGSTNENLLRIQDALGSCAVINVEVPATDSGSWTSGTNTFVWLARDAEDAGTNTGTATPAAAGRARFVVFADSGTMDGDVTVEIRGETDAKFPEKLFFAKNMLSDDRSINFDLNGTDYVLRNGQTAVLYTSANNRGPSNKIAANTVNNALDGLQLASISIGNNASAGIVKSTGDQDLTLQTGNSTTGTITITDGANGAISITPNGTGAVVAKKLQVSEFASQGAGMIPYSSAANDGTLTEDGANFFINTSTKKVTCNQGLEVNSSTGIILHNDETITNTVDGTVLINGIVSAGTGSGAGVFTSNGDQDLTLQTGNSTTGSITITDGSNGDIAITPNGTGEVDISKVDIDGGAIDGTIIGDASAAAITGTSVTGTSLDINGTADISGDLTLSAGADGALNFSVASSIKIADNQAAALVIEEADNAYLTFKTSNSSEAVVLGKKLEAGSVEIEGSAFDINGGAIDATTVGSGTPSSGAFTTVTTSGTATFGTDASGVDVTFHSATSGDKMLWDASDEKLVITGTNGTTSLEVADGNVTVADRLTATEIGAFAAKGSIDFDNQDMTNVDIDSGAIDGTTIGSSSASTGAFTTLTASLATTLNGDVTLGNATGDDINNTGRWVGDFVPKSDSSIDLGTSSFQFAEAHIDAGYIDAITATGTSTLSTVDINGGAIDGTTIGSASASTGAFTTITASTSLDVTGASGIILQNDETITNSANGTVLINGIISGGTGSGAGVFQSNGDQDVTLKTGNSTTGSITITDGSNGDIAITPNGTGEVDISKVDIDSGAIDGTAIGANSASTGAFTTVTTSGTATFGTDGSGVDVTFHSATSGDKMLWDASDEKLVITGTDGATSLEVADGNVTVADRLTATEIGAFAAAGAINFASQNMTNVDIDSGTINDVIIGNQARGGANNVAVGGNSLNTITSGGDKNVAIGQGSGSSLNNDASDFNVVVGYNAGNTMSGADAYQNTCVGSGSGQSSGFNNTAVGYLSLSNVGSATGAMDGNVAIGFKAMGACDNGTDNNVAVGPWANAGGQAGPTGGGNVAIGASALYQEQGHQTIGNVAIGQSACHQVTDAGATVGIGYQCMDRGADTALGGNTAVGTKSMRGKSDNTYEGSQNVAVGFGAMGGDNLTGESHNNVAVGYRAGYELSTGEDNVFVGQLAGNYTTTGEKNIFLGFQAGYASASTESDKLIIDNSDATAPITDAFIYGDMAGGNQSLHVNSGTTSHDATTLTLTTNSTNYTGTMFKQLTEDAGTETDYYFAKFNNHSGAGSSEQTVWSVKGDGETTADTTVLNGADYAEYFEWSDGNPNGDDRVGLSVVLDSDGMCRISTSDDDPEDIFGVVSATANTVGDAAWSRWIGQFQKDDFGRYLYEDVEFVSWIEETETVLPDEDNAGPGAVFKNSKLHEYKVSDAPSEIPDGAVYETRKMKIANPSFDPDLDYVERSDRQEWDSVGLMGKVRLRKGSNVNPSWRKMKDISAVVELWLVR